MASGLHMNVPLAAVVAALVSGDGLFDAIELGLPDAAAAAASVLRAFWGEPGAEANEVSPFRREGCTPEPVEPEPEPLPVPSVFGPVRSPLD